MLRKALYASVTSLGLLSPLAFTSSASAHEFYHHRHHHGCYHVYYRACCYEPWRCAGEFHNLGRARCVADDYRARGFEVRIG
jgi:hypothetical protein